MSDNLIALHRYAIKGKIRELDGQKFEDFFVEIMNYLESDFLSIKPWGNIGDRKCDGYIPTKNTFFQVYSPEKVVENYTSVIKKLENDFKGLIIQWKNVRKFYFVYNDKYKGVNADCAMTICNIQEKNSLELAKLLIAKDVEALALKLERDQLVMLVGYIPSLTDFNTLNYSVLNEVIDHIMNLDLRKSKRDTMVAPNWDEKIEVNGLSSDIKDLLEVGYRQIGDLHSFLENSGEYLADLLQKKMRQVYIEIKDMGLVGDELFYKLLEKYSPTSASYTQAPTIVIMAKYFESCDIFEEPTL